MDLKPSNLLVVDGEQQQGSQSAGQGLVLADAQLHLVMADVLRDVWPSEAALADPYYK